MDHATLGATPGLLLYAQRDGTAPTTRAPRAQGRAAPGPSPRLRVFQEPDADPALQTYEEDTPEPPKPTPTGPFDFGRYLRAKDQRHSPLLINQPHKCRRHDGAFGAGPDLLIAIKSVAVDFERRQAVRQTWGAEGRVLGALVRRVFLLGLPRGAGSDRAEADARTQTHWHALLRAESRAYADILLWAFEDTFFNLTLKEIHFLAWASAYCPDAHFVFKGDADVFVHVENLLEFLAARDPAQDLLAGDVIVQARPIRLRANKYYIPEAVYCLAAYQAYAGDGGSCAQVELFPIDDVFLGMCLQRLRLMPEPHPAFRTFGIPQPSAAPHLHTFHPCFYRELVVVHRLSATDIWLM